VKAAVGVDRKAVVVQLELANRVLEPTRWRAWLSRSVSSSAAASIAFRRSRNFRRASLRRPRSDIATDGSRSS
jgi:hypothetical protein